MSLALFAACLSASVKSPCLFVCMSARFVLITTGSFALQFQFALLCDYNPKGGCGDVNYPGDDSGPTTSAQLSSNTATPLPLNANLQDIYNHLQLERLQPPHQLDHPTTSNACTTSYTTKFYIPLAVENYCFLTSGHDDATTINLFSTTATAESATPLIPLHSLPGKLREPCNRLQMMQSAADAHLWHCYSLTELHTTANHINDYILVTIALPADYIRQLFHQGLHQPLHFNHEQRHPTPRCTTHQLQLQRPHPAPHPVQWLHVGLPSPDQDPTTTTRLQRTPQRRRGRACYAMHPHENYRISRSLPFDQHTWLRRTTLPATTRPQATTNHNASHPNQEL